MEEILHIAIIDKCEELNIRMHERMTDKAFRENEELRRKSITILKEKFSYSDDQIRESCREYFKVIRGYKP
jgi:hypothetical protein